jgi:hypothetical protein
MSFRNVTLALTAAAALTAGSLATAQAAPLPAATSAAVGGTNVAVDHVRWRGGYGGYRGYGYGYRRGGIGVGGALAAGAALGIIGGAVAASQAPYYGGYGYYGRPAYGYYGGYGYAPAYYGGYAPAYGYYGY